MFIKKVKKLKGFTLAEVLITLGIIGVVAALTIPTLISNYQKTQTVTQLKKVYTTLSQAVKMSENDNGPNKNWDWGDGSGDLNLEESFNLYWAPYLRILKICTYQSTCNYPYSKWNDVNGNSLSTSIFALGSRIAFMLQDGTMVVIYAYSGGSTIVPFHYIFVDLDGPKGKSRYGKDVFVFVLDEDKGFMPNGYNHQPSCSKASDGIDCAAKIIKDGWQIKDDYPW